MKAIPNANHIPVEIGPDTLAYYFFSMRKTVSKIIITALIN